MIHAWRPQRGEAQSVPCLAVLRLDPLGQRMSAAPLPCRPSSKSTRPLAGRLAGAAGPCLKAAPQRAFPGVPLGSSHGRSAAGRQW